MLSTYSELYTGCINQYLQQHAHVLKVCSKTKQKRIATFGRSNLSFAYTLLASHLHEEAPIQSRSWVMNHGSVFPLISRDCTAIANWLQHGQICFVCMPQDSMLAITNVAVNVGTASLSPPCQQCPEQPQHPALCWCHLSLGWSFPPSALLSSA